MKPEQHLQKQICSWLRLQHPSVYFMSDASGMRVTMGLRSLLKATRSHHAQLDLIILEPKSIWHGLILELKSESPFTKKGELKKDEHLLDQQKTMEHLFYRDYEVFWAWEFEQAKQIIEDYLKQTKNPHLSAQERLNS